MKPLIFSGSAVWGVFLNLGDANFMIHPECFFYDMVQRPPTA